MTLKYGSGVYRNCMFPYGQLPSVDVDNRNITMGAPAARPKSDTDRQLNMKQHVSLPNHRMWSSVQC